VENDNSPLQLRFLVNPVYWFTWLGIGLLYLTTFLSYGAMLRLGTALGWMSYMLLPGRRRITRTNLRLVYPELDRQAVTRLVKQSFYSASIAVFESAWAWWASDAKIKPLVHIEGAEHLDAALQHNKGVLLLGGHFTTLEISGRLLAYHYMVYPTYKRAHNDLFEAFMTRNRRSMQKGLVRSADMRAMLKLLKHNEIIWYAPDQDFGMRVSVFAPFMGVQTATLPMTARLAARSGAAVVPFASRRLPGTEGYVIRFDPMLENFPSGDDVQDATSINAAIETNVRLAPEQYLWGHRRFKSRPRGEPQVYAHRRDRSLRRYAQVLMLLSVPAFFYTLWLGYRNRDPGYIKQRYGFFPSVPQNVDLWFHAASVGEVNAVLPLILALHERHPHKKIALSTFTPTGAAIARKKLPPDIMHCYLPIDYEYAIKRFLQYLSPACSVIMETELWPHLHQYCFNLGIPVIILNGRLSDKSYRSRGWIRHLMSRSIEFTFHILARTEQDKARFIDMVAAEEKVDVLGNIKFAIANAQAPATIDLGRPYVLAASTHADEEVRIARVWQQLDLASHLLVIVPRHPHRSSEISKQLDGFNLALRSKQQPVTAETQIYLADTFGELGGFIAGAEFVFMGGSLVNVGGHNILEVGALGKAVIFGPSMHNFADERSLYLDNNAAIEVKDDNELQAAMQDLVQHPQKATQIGERAFTITRAQQHILHDYITRLEQVCPALFR